MLPAAAVIATEDVHVPLEFGGCWPDSVLAFGGFLRLSGNLGDRQAACERCSVFHASDWSEGARQLFEQLSGWVNVVFYTNSSGDSDFRVPQERARRRLRPPPRALHHHMMLARSDESQASNSAALQEIVKVTWVKRRHLILFDPFHSCFFAISCSPVLPTFDHSLQIRSPPPNHPAKTSDKY